MEFDEEKLLRSTQYVEAVLKEQGPFDGIVGFSQVRWPACTLVAVQEQDGATPRCTSYATWHRSCTCCFRTCCPVICPGMFLVARLAAGHLAG